MGRSAEDGEDISKNESWYGIEDVEGWNAGSEISYIYHVPPVLSSLLLFYSMLSTPHLPCPALPSACFQDTSFLNMQRSERTEVQTDRRRDR